MLIAIQCFMYYTTHYSNASRPFQLQYVFSPTSYYISSIMASEISRLISESFLCCLYIIIFFTKSLIFTIKVVC